MFELLTPLMALNRLFLSPTYGESLDQYITDRNPKDAGDVERLTIEYTRKQNSWWSK